VFLKQAVKLTAILPAKLARDFWYCWALKHEDTVQDVAMAGPKIANMRVFGDENGLMNKAIADVEGEILLISQFTLYRPNKERQYRPSFIRAARPEKAIPLYEYMINELS
jgi:D-tyrosyl-tRNA(Tyr) deacylase